MIIGIDASNIRTGGGKKHIEKFISNSLKEHNNIKFILVSNSKLNSSPSSQDLGFIVGPQINAASRIDDSSLASKLLITNE